MRRTCPTRLITKINLYTLYDDLKKNVLMTQSFSLRTSIKGALPLLNPVNLFFKKLQQITFKNNFFIVIYKIDLK